MTTRVRADLVLHAAAISKDSSTPTQTHTIDNRWSHLPSRRIGRCSRAEQVGVVNGVLAEKLKRLALPKHRVAEIGPWVPPCIRVSLPDVLRVVSQLGHFRAQHAVVVSLGWATGADALQQWAMQ